MTTSIENLKHNPDSLNIMVWVRDTEELVCSGGD
jgi:hypothetical protein